MVPVSDSVWTFDRSGERLEIRRGGDTGDRLTITRRTPGADDDERTYQFSDAVGLVAFQSNMEAMLVQTGWSFVAFSPEQRSGRDRRTWPRLSDRRRWWTDGRPARSRTGRHAARRR